MRNTRIVTTPLNVEEQLDAASNYLHDNSSDIPPWVIAPLIAEAAEEYLEEFTTHPVISDRLKQEIHRRIEDYRQQEPVN